MKQTYSDGIQVLTSQCIAEVSGLMGGGLLLYALLAGGDYSPGIAGCGPVLALALAHCFGNDLQSAIKCMDVGSHEEDGAFKKLQDQICSELETNSRGFLGFCHPGVVKHFPETFPDHDVLNLYYNPAISASS